MKRAFTLTEMLISIALTAIVFTYLYTTLENVKKSHSRFKESSHSVISAQHIFSLFAKDLSQIRQAPDIAHEAGYDRFSIISDHSVYGIARPWIHYYISAKERALIRIEATRPIDFFRTEYIGDFNSTYFFADKLATGCDSLRITEKREEISIMLRCKDIAPIVMTLYKGDL